MNAPIDLIRKEAAAELGRRYLEERFGPKAHSPLATVSLKKAASATNKRLLRAAAWVSGGGDALEMYELLGGTYKGIGG